MRKHNDSMNRVEISMLVTFLSVIRTGSMSATAKEMGITQPAVSTSISRLEKILGVKLLDRSARPMKLTSFGRILQKKGEAILNDLDHLSGVFQQKVDAPKLDLRIGFSDSFGATVVHHFLHKLTGKARNISAYTAATPKIVKMILDDRLDAAIATREVSDESSIISQRILTEKFLAVTPKKYGTNLRTFEELKQIAQDLPVIRFNDESLDAIQVERVLRRCNAKSDNRIEADTNLSVLGMVNHGAGWSVMSPLAIWMAREQTENVVFHDIVGTTRSFFIMHKSLAYEKLAETIAAESRATLSDYVLPAIRNHFPQLADCIWVEEEEKDPNLS